VLKRKYKKKIQTSKNNEKHRPFVLKTSIGKIRERKGKVEIKENLLKRLITLC